jgi:hypothetical protein
VRSEWVDKTKKEAQMDLLQTIGTDGALLIFSAAGLVATTLAILRDTQVQRTHLAKEPVRFQR